MSCWGQPVLAPGRGFPTRVPSTKRLVDRSEFLDAHDAARRGVHRQAAAPQQRHTDQGFVGEARDRVSSHRARPAVPRHPHAVDGKPLDPAVGQLGVDRTAHRKAQVLRHAGGYGKPIGETGVYDRPHIGRAPGFSRRRQTERDLGLTAFFGDVPGYQARGGRASPPWRSRWADFLPTRIR